MSSPFHARHPSQRDQMPANRRLTSGRPEKRWGIAASLSTARHFGKVWRGSVLCFVKLVHPFSCLLLVCMHPSFAQAAVVPRYIDYICLTMALFPWRVSGASGCMSPQELGARLRAIFDIPEASVRACRRVA